MRRLVAGILLLGALSTGIGIYGGHALPPSPSPNGAPPPIQVSNFLPGERVDYPVVLIRGRLTDETAETVSWKNAANGSQGTGLAHAGRFNILLELARGENRLTLIGGQAQTDLCLDYRPVQGPPYCRVFYFVEASGNTAYPSPLPEKTQDFPGRLATMMKTLQSFTAESLRDQGFGRRTLQS